MRENIPPENPDDYFTMVITTYNRQDVFKTVIENYCTIPEIDQILLIWNNLDLDKFPIPKPEDFNCIVPVRPLKMSENQVSNRLMQAPHIRTNAIFQVDDDIIINPKDIRLAFNIWKGDQDRMVGFQARTHLYSGGRYHYSFDVKDGFSIVVGAAHFIHKRFYEMFASDSPLTNQVRNYVRTASCCDDIAMNSLVSYTTKKGPILMNVPHYGLNSKGFGGKSLQTGWTKKRGDSINAYVEFFGELPLVESNVIVTRLEHQPGRWYNYQGFLQDWLYWILNK
eukprot:TRINITY_DN2064_c0_g4_i1.p1 TRINITY_DN2064_c0_g4~~TRINITY_DN2064_c0_g4_i1.p1  ORF type:complete len:281 (+),score=76.67 TRINITY_DN2064_c0_g4_i1:303-1145(+)